MLDEVRLLVRLAWPVVLGQLGLVMLGVVDLLMVGHLGQNATAAVGIGNTLSFSTLILALGAAAGLDPLITQAFGAGRPGRAGTEAARGAVIALALSVPIIGVHVAAEPILTALRQDPVVIPDAARFCRISAWGVVPMALFAVTRQQLQGNGVMRPAMWVVVAANVVNLVVVYVLVQRLGFGVAGAAWCTAIVRWVMFLGLLALSWQVLAASRPDEPVFAPAELARVARIAIPVAVQIGLEVWAFNAASFAAGSLGATAAAAHTAALSCASVAFMVPMGFSAAAATRVGNLVGAGRPWRRAGAVAVGVGALVQTVAATLFLTLPTELGRLYNPDPDVIGLVAVVLPIAAGFQLFDGTQVVSFGVLRGLGDTRFPVLFNVLGYWVVGLPVGAALAFSAGWGLPGLWVGLTIGLGIVAVLLLARLAAQARRDVVRAGGG